MKITAIVLPFVFLVGLSPNALSSMSQTSDEDGAFLVKASELSQQGEADAQAASRSTQAEIHATAESVASDHARIRRKLSDLAQARGLQFPGLLHKGAGESFETATDSDRIAGLLKAHENAVALFHQEAVRGDDPDLKRFAENTVPTLQRRLLELRALQDRYPPPGV